MQVNKFMEDLVKYYNDRLLAWIQQALNLLSVFSDNCGYQFKSRYPFISTGHPSDSFQHYFFNCSCSFRSSQTHVCMDG